MKKIYTADSFKTTSGVDLAVETLLKGGYTGTAEDLRVMIASVMAGVTIVNGVTPTSAIPATGNIYTIVTTNGTYVNWNNLVVPVNSMAVLMRVDGVFSLSQTTFDITSKVNVSDVINTLVSTETTKPLSAAQGKVLNEKFKSKVSLFVGKNIFNKATATLNYFLTNNNVANSSTTYDYSDFIPVVAGQQYISAQEMRFVTYFSEDKSFISGGASVQTYTVTPPDGVFFIRITISHSVINSFQLEKGSVTTLYEAYTNTMIESELPYKYLKESDLSTIGDTVKSNPNYTVIAKANSINPTLVQVDMVFDLNGISFISGDIVTINFNINSTDSNLASALKSRIFQNDNANALSTVGTQILPFSIGSYLAPTTDITFTKATTIGGFRYLHVYLETTLTIATQLTTFIYKNPKVTLNGNSRLPIAFGIYNKNVNDSIVYKPFLPSDLIRYSDLLGSLSTYVPANNLTGRKIAIIGDSMVKGHTLPSTEVWDYLIASRNSMTNLNYGINGVQLTNNNAYGSSVLNGYSAMDSNADYVGVFAGTNDVVAGVTIGVDTDSFASGQLTFKGALNDLCSGLITKYPNKKIFFITPYYRYSASQPYITAILTICKKYSIPVFDNSENGGICWTNTNQVASITLGDTYHLNTSGMIYVSTKYESFLKSL